MAQWQGIFDPNLELFVLSDCDQVSFHDPRLLAAGGALLHGASMHLLPWPGDERES